MQIKLYSSFSFQNKKDSAKGFIRFQTIAKISQQKYFTDFIVLNIM